MSPSSCVRACLNLTIGTFAVVIANTSYTTPRCFFRVFASVSIISTLFKPWTHKTVTAASIAPTERYTHTKKWEFHAHYANSMSIFTTFSTRSSCTDIFSNKFLFFGHLCHADTTQDYSRTLQECIWGPLKDWGHRTGRYRQKWLIMAEDDLHPINFGSHARYRLVWWLLTQVATSSWHAPESEFIQTAPGSQYKRDVMNKIRDKAAKLN